MDAYSKYAIATFIPILFIFMPLYLPIALKKSDGSWSKVIPVVLCIVGVVFEWLVLFYVTLGIVW